LKRIVLYGIVLAVAMLIPVERADVAQLRPIEVIALYCSGDTVVLETDTGDLGMGQTAAQALAHMRSTTPALIYLDTARYLLVSDGAREQVQQLRQYLKPSVQLCQLENRVDLQQAARYLPVHGSYPALKRWQTQNSLPILTETGGRLTLQKVTKTTG